jgi:ubiquinone/menaquinone biosynthesis C-methylase UbiE
MGRPDQVWQTSALVATYLEGLRAAFPQAQEQIDVLLRLIAAARGERVLSFLDLGCGDGVLANAVLDRFPSAHGVLADFSEPMLEAARQRLAHHAGRAQYIHADYALPDWVDSVQPFAPFDAVISGFSIHHQPDGRKREVYGEIYGLLASGGIFVNVEHVASPTDWLAALQDELFVDHLHAVHAGQTRAQVAANYHNRPDKAANILAPVEVQCQWLREIGFTDVDCYLKIFEQAVFGGRRR